MRLKQFKGKDVRGYMNFDINFRESVTFLIGINGSGKTTVLKLLSGMLEPSYRILNNIEFSELSLLCKMDDGQLRQIVCKKENKKIYLSYNDDRGNDVSEGIFETSEVFQVTEEQSEFAREEFVKNLGLFENSEIVKKIKSIQTPLFLGINRRVIEMSTRESITMREVQMHRRRRMIDDAVDRALLDIQNMVFDYVRQNAKRQSVFADNFRKKVVHDSFKFYNEVPLIIGNYNKELSLLGQKRDSLKIAIQELGLDDLSNELDDVFNKLEALLKQLIEQSEKEPNQDYYNTLFKWMVNSSQL